MASATDGWTLNKKIDKNYKELKEYIMYLGAKVLTLEERMDKLDGKERKDPEGNA